MVGQRETLAPAQVIDTVAGKARLVAGDQWHQVLVVELRRRLEQHPVAMPCAPGGGQGRPRSVTGRELQLLRMGLLVLLPRSDLVGEGELAERFAQQTLGSSVCIKIGDVLGLELAQRVALYEQALDAEDRCQIVMLLRQRASLLFDAEQPGHEILDLRCQCNQQFGLRFRCDCVGRIASRYQGFAQRRVGLRDVVEELGVEAHKALALVKVRVFKSKRQLEHVPGVP